MLGKKVYPLSTISHVGKTRSCLKTFLYAQCGKKVISGAQLGSRCFCLFRQYQMKSGSESSSSRYLKPSAFLRTTLCFLTFPYQNYPYVQYESSYVPPAATLAIHSGHCNGALAGELEINFTLARTRSRRP